MKNSLKVKAIEKSSIVKEAYKEIKKLILSKSFINKINQEKIASLLGISRTPVVIALNQLAAEGYLTQIPYKGYYVKEHSHQDMVNLNEVRILYEELGVKKIIETLDDKKIKILQKYIINFKNFAEKNDIGSYRNMDIDFHKFIVKETKNKYIIDQYLKDIVVANATGSFIPLKDSLAKHKELVDSVFSRNKKKASELIKEHISSQLYNSSKEQKSRKEKK